MKRQMSEKIGVGEKILDRKIDRKLESGKIF